MNTKIYLQRGFFAENAKTIMENDEFKVNLFKYSSGVEAIEVTNSRGKIIVLPYMGQMIWRVEFDGIDLTMKNMFSKPRKVNNILDTYGCFAFHSYSPLIITSSSLNSIHVASKSAQQNSPCIGCVSSLDGQPLAKRPE